MAASRKVALRYQEQLIPLRQQIVESSMLHYNYMLVGVFQLLSAKQEEVSAKKEHIEAIRDYWISRSQLERAVGQRLGLTGTKEVKPVMTPEDHETKQEVPQLHHEHHHGGQS